MKKRWPFGCHAALNTSAQNGSFGSGLRFCSFLPFGSVPSPAGGRAGWADKT